MFQLVTMALIGQSWMTALVPPSLPRAPFFQGALAQAEVAAPLEPLAFATLDGLFVVNADGNHRQPLPAISTVGGDYQALVWAPNGQTLAVVHDYSNVSIVPMDGSTPKTIFRSDCFRPPMLDLRWQPNNNLLIKQVCAPSTSDTEGSFGLYLSQVQTNSAQPRLLSVVPSDIDSDYYLSPDGTQVAYVSGEHIYTVAVDGGMVTQLTQTPGSYAAAGSPLAWSPDGSQIAFFEGTYPNQRLYVIDADGSDRRLLTPDPEYQIYRSRLIWSPDGRFIAFYSPYSPPYSNQEVIQVVNVNTEEIQTLTRPGFYDAISWSPNSQQMVFAVGNRFSSQVIYLLDLPSQRFTQLTENPVRQILQTQWSPDGDWIAFTAESTTGEFSNQQLYTVRPDGTDLKALTSAEEYAYPFTWQPSP